MRLININYKGKTVRNTNTWRLNNMFLNNQEAIEEIKRKIKNFLETNDNENTTQNLQEAAKAFLRGKFIAIQSYLQKKETSNRQLKFTPKTTGKRKTTTTTKTPKISRRKEIKQI